MHFYLSKIITERGETTNPRKPASKASLIVNNFKVEHQCASQLIGHYYLIQCLNQNGCLNENARIIWVSSGGMYLKKLDLKTLFQNNNYEKVSTYANVKRAQVTLAQELSKKDFWRKIGIFSMHPGWVKTDRLSNSLPGFFKIMKKRLISCFQNFL